MLSCKTSWTPVIETLQTLFGWTCHCLSTILIFIVVMLELPIYKTLPLLFIQNFLRMSFFPSIPCWENNSSLLTANQTQAIVLPCSIDPTNEVFKFRHSFNFRPWMSITVLVIIVIFFILFAL